MKRGDPQSRAPFDDAAHLRRRVEIDARQRIVGRDEASRRRRGALRRHVLHAGGRVCGHLITSVTVTFVWTVCVCTQLRPTTNLLTCTLYNTSLTEHQKLWHRNTTAVEERENTSFSSVTTPNSPQQDVQDVAYVFVVRRGHAAGRARGGAAAASRRTAPAQGRDARAGRGGASGGVRALPQGRQAGVDARPRVRVARDDREAVPRGHGRVPHEPKPRRGGQA
mmetsp:Transcript_18656/g.57482  ORF Transcript_18656/g.57482 Transcript_18656/m.57482 type:complete len:223 (-) Transcript_18656:1426-2094(-)